MVLSRRERYIVIATVATVALLALDRVVFTPLQDAWAAMRGERDAVLGDLEQGSALLKRRRQAAPRWEQALQAGLKTTSTEAESQALHALRNWSQETNFALTSLRPERTGKAGELQEVSFQAAGTGPMSAVSAFLWRIESSALPLRVTDLQMGARKEGSDDLTLQLRLSTLFAPPSAPAPSRKEEGKNE